MSNRKSILVMFLSLAVLWTSPAFAEGSFLKGETEWGVSAGFGDNFHLSDTVSEDVEFYFLAPYWGKVLTTGMGPGALELVTEGFFSYVRQDSKDRYAVGVTPLLVFNFVNSGRVVPFVELGVGILYTDLNAEDFGSHFNFTPQAGVGLRYEIADRTFLNLAYRYHHVSNAFLDEDNASIDSNFFMIGISFLR